MKILVSLIFTLIAYIGLSQVEKNMVLIKGGTYVPLYSLVTGKVTVGSFYMDKYPVTNADFELFIQKNPSWAKNNIKPIFADENTYNIGLRQLNWQLPKLQILEARLSMYLGLQLKNIANV